MSKKRICFIAQFPPPIHGLSKAVETLYNSNLNEEFEFEKVDITNNRKILKNLIKITKSHADIFYFTISQTQFGNLRDLVIFKLLELRRKNCLIHLHGGYYRQLVDNDLPSWQRKMNLKAISRLKGVIVLGESLKPIFQDMIDDEKIFVVPNCVDDKFLLSNSEFEEKVAAMEHKELLHVLYLSNFIRSKGYPEVLEMARLEKERVANGKIKRFHFDFAGKFFEESEWQYFEKFVEEHQLHDFITYHGVVTGDKKRELLRNGDIFALFTRYPNEGQPISILEAMGNGMVIVTTDHAGILDMVKKDVSGYVLEKKILGESVKDVYSYISNLRKEEIQKIFIYNRNSVVTRYIESLHIERMKSVFNYILDKVIKGRFII